MMPHNDILSLPAGRELDALVVEKVMGYRHHPWTQTIPEHWCRLPTGETCLFADLPHYSTSIAAAWEVVERLPYRLVRIVREGGSWYCTVGDELNYPMFAPIRADTAPLAICRTALKAVMG